MAESDVIVVSSKGQVVIPQSLREKLRIGPKSKLLVYEYGNSIVLKKLDVDDAMRKLKTMYERIDAKIARYGALTQDEIQQEIEKYRAEKHKRKGA